MITGKSPAEARWAASFVLLFMAGASLAAFVFFLDYDRGLEHVTGNAMDKSSRDTVIQAMAGTGLAFALASVIFWMARGYTDAAVSTVLRMARIISPLMVMFP